MWPSWHRLGLALASTPVGSSATRLAAESRRTAADGAHLDCNVACGTVDWTLIDDARLHGVVIAPRSRAGRTAAICGDRCHVPISRALDRVCRCARTHTSDSRKV